MFTTIFGGGGNEEEEAVGAAPKYKTPTIYGYIAFRLFLLALPFLGFWLLFLTAERGLQTFERFHIWPWTKNPVTVRAAENASDAYHKYIEIKSDLDKLEDAGEALWGQDHTWRITGFHPDWTARNLEGRITNPHFSAAWEKHTTDKNRVEAEEVVKQYTSIRIAYSRFKFEIDEIHQNARKAANGLPDDATILRALDNLNAYFDTEMIRGEVQEFHSVFDTKVAPFFSDDKTMNSGPIWFTGSFGFLILTLAGASKFVDLRIRFFTPSNLDSI